jgi:hypothetical protein
MELAAKTRLLLDRLRGGARETGQRLPPAAEAPPGEKTEFLPNFCTGEVVFNVVVVAEMLAIVINLIVPARFSLAYRVAGPAADLDLHPVGGARRHRRAVLHAQIPQPPAQPARAGRGLPAAAAHHLRGERMRCLAAVGVRPAQQRAAGMVCGFSHHQSHHQRHHQRAAAAAVPRQTRIAEPHAVRGARQAPGTAVAHPSALRVQQHEHHRLAHAQRAGRRPRPRSRTWPTCSA